MGHVVERGVIMAIRSRC